MQKANKASCWLALSRRPQSLSKSPKVPLQAPASESARSPGREVTRPYTPESAWKKRMTQETKLLWARPTPLFSKELIYLELYMKIMEEIWESCRVSSLDPYRDSELSAFLQSILSTPWVKVTRTWLLGFTIHESTCGRKQKRTPNTPVSPERSQIPIQDY